MAVTPVTWDHFRVNCIARNGVTEAFEELCRQVFLQEILKGNKNLKWTHSNPNNPGVEVDPIWDEVRKRNVSFQAKFFDSKVGYKQIRDSMQKAVDHYQGKLNCIYLFCNKDLNVNSKIYKEIESFLKEAGIALVPITGNAILDMVRKHPWLAEYYFGSHQITHEWLVNKAELAISSVGFRYNQDLNLETEASKLLSVFVRDQNAVDYYNRKKETLLNEISSARWLLADYSGELDRLKTTVESISDIEISNLDEVKNWFSYIERDIGADIKRIEDRSAVIKAQLHDLQNSGESDFRDLLKEKRKLRSLLDMYHSLAVSDQEKQLLSGKFLVLRGEAGMGKTHLLVRMTQELLNKGENALLILGGNLLSDNNILDQLRDDLRIDQSFETLIELLEVMGQANGRIVPIFIDAANDSANPGVWKCSVPMLLSELMDKNHVRLVISARSENLKNIIPDNFLQQPDVVEIEHYGFKDNPYDAVLKFFEFYGIPFSPIQIFSSFTEIPLFLTFYCKTHYEKEVSLPNLFESLLEGADKRVFSVKRNALRNSGYDSPFSLVQKVVEYISEFMFDTGEFRIKEDMVENFALWDKYRLAAIPFIKQMKEEGILLASREGKSTYLYFKYDGMRDYYTAKAAVSRYKNQEELRDFIIDQVLEISDGKAKGWHKQNLFVYLCALYAEYYHEECIDILTKISDPEDKVWLYKAYLGSLEWRTEIFINIDELLEYSDQFNVDAGLVWNAIISRSLSESRSLNANALHVVLKKLSIVQRDYLWTTYINGLNSEDRAVQLVEFYCKGKSFAEQDQESVRRLLILFSWMLSSSNRWLRDMTSKAMTEILNDHFEYCQYLLELFSNVNDPYIFQRLYAVVFGACTRRTGDKREEYDSLVHFIYKQIFDQDFVYPDILLRDSARLIIEFYLHEYPGSLSDLDLSKIRPPYQSDPIPLVEEIVNPLENLKDGEYAVWSSLRFLGCCLTGDFGRYIFEAAVKYFDVDRRAVFNYALHYIFNELGYKNDYFAYYDGNSTKRLDFINETNRTERIGKKYQWVTLYNILARISDHHLVKEDPYIASYDEPRFIPYEGPWHPLVRDFDPTINKENLLNPEAPLFQAIIDHHKLVAQEHKNEENRPDFSEDQWLDSSSTFFQYQKEDFLLTDDKGEEWVVLTKYADTRNSKFSNFRLLERSSVFSYFVSDEQLSILNHYVTNHSIPGYDLFREPDTSALYSREYPWSDASRSIIQDQYFEIELPLDGSESEADIKKYGDRVVTLEQPVFEECEIRIIENLDSEVGDEDPIDREWILRIPGHRKGDLPEQKVVKLGKLLNSTQSIVWDTQFDDSIEDGFSYYHPCAELIDSLGLSQKEYDCYYYDSDGGLAAFDTSLNHQQAGFIIRKSLLDRFLKANDYHLVWFVNASKEIYGDDRSKSKVSEWSAMLEYENGLVKGEFKIEEPR